MKGTGTTLTRRQKALRYGLLLLLSLAVILYALDFPIPTANLARRATERRYCFGPSEVLCTLEEPLIYSRSYAVRWEDWYGVVSVLRFGPFWWDTGLMKTVKNDPDQPLTPLENSFYLFQDDPIIVFSSDPTIVSVTLEFPVRPRGGEVQLISVTQDQGQNGCFSLFLPYHDGQSWTYSSHFRLSGYDADGKLVWRSPTPTGAPEGWDYLFGPDALDL